LLLPKRKGERGDWCSRASTSASSALGKCNKDRDSGRKRKRQRRRVGTFFRSVSWYGSSRGKGKKKEVEHNDGRGSLKMKENTMETARADAAWSESTWSVSKAGK
jgi:hypothetical protein